MKTFQRISLVALSLLSLLIPLKSFTADHVCLTMQNATKTSNTLEFDVFIVNDGTTTLNLRGYQFGINFDSVILNGATPVPGVGGSYIYLGQRDPIFNSLSATSSQYNNKHLRNVSSNSTIANSVNIPIGVSFKLGRFRFSNAVNWTPGSVPNLQFQQSYAAGKTQAIVTVYSPVTLTSSNLQIPLPPLTGATLCANSLISNLALNIALPVNLSSFTGIKSGLTHTLNWTTSQEENNNYFNLQYSKNGINFETIAKVNSLAERGNSSTPLNYSSQYSSPSFGHNYYRLEQVDIDGRATIETKTLDLIECVDGSQVLLSPNPTKDLLNVTIASENTQALTINVLDLTGRLIKKVNTILLVGSNDLFVDLTNMSNGTYLIQVLGNNKPLFTGKINKIN